MQTLTDALFLPLRDSFADDRESFAFALLLGIVLGAVYDLLRALRRGAHTGRLFEHAADFVFALCYFFSYFVLSVARTGNMRFFTLAGMLLGSAAERYTLGRALIFAFSPVFALLRRVFDLTLGRLFARFVQKIKAAFVKSKSQLRKFQKKPKKVLKV